MYVCMYVCINEWSFSVYTAQYQYFFQFPRQQVVTFQQEPLGSYDIVVGSGDDTALEPDLRFQLTLENVTPISGAGEINLTPNVSVAVQDPDGI